MDITLETILKAVGIALGVAQASLGDSAAVTLAVGQIEGLTNAARKILAGDEPEPLESYDEGLQNYLNQAAQS